MNSKAIKQKYTFDNDNNSLNKNRIVSVCITDCATKSPALNVSNQNCEVVVHQGREKKLKLVQAYMTEKISDYGMDLIALTLIFLIPTIPFWQL